MESKLDIVIAESSPIIAVGLLHTVRKLPGCPAHVTEISNPDELEECLRFEKPNILIANPAFGGVFNPEPIRAMVPEIKIVAIATGHMDKLSRSLYDEVISVVDDIDTIVDKLRRMVGDDDSPLAGKEPLSQREKEIVSLVVTGLTNKEIADRLFLSPHTVITHRRNIARKLDIHSATGLTIYAIVNNLVNIKDIKVGL